MAGPVGDKGDEIGISARFTRPQPVENSAEGLHQLQVGALVFAADIIAASKRAPGGDK